VGYMYVAVTPPGLSRHRSLRVVRRGKQ